MLFYIHLKAIYILLCKNNATNMTPSVFSLLGVYFMISLLKQLKKRRLELNLTQNDMLLRIGVSRQQYQKLESKGNPRLDTLELVAKGLNSELMLIPAEKTAAVRAILESSGSSIADVEKNRTSKSLPDAPWQDLLEDDEL